MPRLRQVPRSEAPPEVLQMYERLFGPKSDWVEGTRLLAQFYEDAAAEQERMAARHLEAVPGRQEDRPLLDRSLRRSGP